MIAKTTIGRSFKGCCGYNLAKVEKGKGEILLSQGVRDYDQKAMVSDFLRQASLNPDLSRCVWHTAISFSPQDEARLQRQPELIKQVAQDYLKGMGLADSQYVVIQHRDTQHSHVHLIANRVDNQGQTVSDSHNFSRSQQLLRQLEAKHGLTPLTEQAQRQDLTKVPEGDRQRLALRDQVRQCVGRSASHEELHAELSRYQIRMRIRYDQAGQGRGVTFEQERADGSEPPVIFKGSKLHANLSLGHIQAQLGRQQQERRLNPAQKAPNPAQEPRTAPRLTEVPQEEQIPEITLKRGHGRRL